MPSRVRVRPWPVDPTTAHLVPHVSRRPTPGDLARLLAQLRDAGYRRVRTAALSPAEARPFLDVGFVVDEHLHLLRHDLHRLPPTPRSAPLRRARRGDRPAVLAVDAAAFSPPWRLDETGLRDALAATPSVRFRVAGGAAVRGYAIAGRAGIRGYLQRLAVDPAAANQGLGRALAIDALLWLRRRGARRALVNTQEGNEAALHLYESLGFRPESEGLAVLGTGLAR
jgi:ribosomal protein S18 acetylase RimI-like enzyme